jgi:hypothetical protein
MNEGRVLAVFASRRHGVCGWVGPCVLAAEVVANLDLVQKRRVAQKRGHSSGRVTHQPLLLQETHTLHPTRQPLPSDRHPANARTHTEREMNARPHTQTDAQTCHAKTDKPRPVHKFRAVWHKGAYRKDETACVPFQGVC